MEATRIGGGMRKTSCFGLRRVPACLASTRRDRDGAATTSAHGARRNGWSPRSHRARIANPRASSSPAMAESVDAASGEEERAPASAFVAGATGRTGLRVVKELVESGISVKAGVRSSAKYEETFKSILSDAEKAEKLSFEQIDLDDGRTLANGVSGCDVVVCCLGAPENEFNPENPKRIDGDGVIALIDEAKRSGTCSHFVLVTSLGTGRFGWPASILNLFFGVLFHKKRAEDHLVKSGLAFTIVRPGGMERPTDDYYVQNEAVLRPQDTQFGGQVSRTQISWLVRDCVNNPSKAQNKVIEVVTKKAKVVGAEDGAKKKKDKDEEEEYETYDLSLVDQLEKIPSAGNAAAEGTPAWFTSRYAYEATKVDTLMKTMGFRGSAPEVVNGRLAMLALVALVGEELANGKALGPQITDQIPGILAVVSVVTSASLVPLVKGVEISHADLGIFKSGAEKLNGRLAMLALAYLVAGEAGVVGGEKKQAAAVVADAARGVRDYSASLDAKVLALGLGLALLLAVVTSVSAFLPFQVFFSSEESGSSSSSDLGEE